MKITSRKPKGQRIFKTVKLKIDRPKFGNQFRRDLIIEVRGGWWYDITNDKWVLGYNPELRLCSSYYPKNKSKRIYSFKAAKRKIAKWGLPKNTKVFIGLPFVGYDFNIIV